MKVAIPGATGFVGSRLVERLNEEGHELLVFSRDPERARRVFPEDAFPTLEIVAYDPKNRGAWQEAIAGSDAVVNLVGEPIAEKRWTTEEKREILESRQLATRYIVEGIANADPKPSVLVNTSAIGYYGTSETETFDESSPPGNDFLAEVCQAWEKEAETVKETGTRLVILRLGIVVGNGGAIAKMLLPFRLFAGGPMGDGRQWFSWIDREDVVNLIVEGLKRPEMEGIFNATAPNPVKMNELCETLGEVMDRPSWLPVPGFALELLLGDGAKVVLEGQRVLPKRAQEIGFQYRYPDLEPALEKVVSEA